MQNDNLVSLLFGVNHERERGEIEGKECGDSVRGE